MIMSNQRFIIPLRAMMPANGLNEPYELGGQDAVTVESTRA
jgi:hypothetical protein